MLFFEKNFMKTALLSFTFILAVSFSALSQKIFTVDSRYDADVKVFVTDSRYDADLLVFKVDSRYDATGNKGLWHFVSSRYDADKKIFFVTSRYDADVLIFFVNSRYDAEWRNKSKMHHFF